MNNPGLPQELLDLPRRAWPPPLSGSWLAASPAPRGRLPSRPPALWLPGGWQSQQHRRKVPWPSSRVTARHLVHWTPTHLESTHIQSIRPRPTPRCSAQPPRRRNPLQPPPRPQLWTPLPPQHSRLRAWHPHVQRPHQRLQPPLSPPPPQLAPLHLLLLPPPLPPRHVPPVPQSFDVHHKWQLPLLDRCLPGHPGCPPPSAVTNRISCAHLPAYL
mmetsp:Transcript_75486/g.208277  ORF Transcript_75486/g.208277 Transcript_75486/m.208277 type:complete len:215 (-) Transcript_75486:223-867(-)